MFVEGLAWTKEPGAAHWTGRSAKMPHTLAYVIADDDPQRFVATVFVRGTQVHQSEHDCSCGAKTAVETAMMRAALLREGWP